MDGQIYYESAFQQPTENHIYVLSLSCLPGWNLFNFISSLFASCGKNNVHFFLRNITIHHVSFLYQLQVNQQQDYHHSDNLLVSSQNKPKIIDLKEEKLDLSK